LESKVFWKKGALQNPLKRFYKFQKASKCVQSLKKRIKNSTEPFEGSAFYPTAEPSLTVPFLGSVQQERFREKIRNLEGSVQNH
jgi:hypothetical protein